MPTANSFRYAFGLKRGGGDGETVKIVTARSTHEVVEKARKYRYSIDLVFAAGVPMGTVRKWLNSVIASHPIVYTRWGNPYSCHIIPEYTIHKVSNRRKSAGRISVSLEGLATREMTLTGRVGQTSQK
jgi:hypothetical protein